MEPDTSVALLIALHRGLDRLGPSDDASTRRALDLCTELPAEPDILDIGCGAGAQTLTLLRSTTGRVTAVDLAPSFLEHLQQRAEAEHLADRLVTVEADMGALPFERGSFDLIWSEGAIYNLGFDRGLIEWRRLLRANGWLVVSDLVWLSDDRPAALEAWWTEQVPGIRHADAHIANAEQLGYRVAGSFVLPAKAWEAYYGPLRDRFEAFLGDHVDDPNAAALIEATREEMAMVENHHDHVGYVMFVLRKHGC